MFGAMPTRQPTLASTSSAAEIRMPHNVALRASQPMWFARCLQTAATCIVLGVTAANASDWTSAQCQIPSLLGVNVLAASISIPLLGYLLASTGKQRFDLPWSHLFQLIVDAFLLTMWVLATPASEYTCSAVCKSCSSSMSTMSQRPANFYMWVGKLTCSCSFQSGSAGSWKVYASRVLRQAFERPGKGAVSTRIISTAQRMAAKKGFDYFMCVLFAITLVATAWSIVQQSRLARRRAAGLNVHVPKEYSDEKRAYSVSVTPVSPQSPKQSPKLP